MELKYEETLASGRGEGGAGVLTSGDCDEGGAGVVEVGVGAWARGVEIGVRGGVDVGVGGGVEVGVGAASRACGGRRESARRPTTTQGDDGGVIR